MKKKVLLLICFLVYFSGNSFSQLSALPASAQAIIFKKVFSYIKELQSSENIRVLVVFNENNSQLKNEIVKAFQNEDINVNATRVENLVMNANNISIIYIVPGTASSGIKAFCAAKNILSITGDPELVTKGFASIGIGSVKDKKVETKKLLPRIIMHLGQLQDESQEITELLSLDSIIKIK